MSNESGALIGIDLGAGSLKVSVVARDGRFIASASMSVDTSSPEQGWSEQDPHQWWSSLCGAVPKALREARLTAKDIAAVSISAGAHTCVLVDEQDQVIRPAIMWNDQRSLAECDLLRAEAGSMIGSTAGNQITPTWTLPQLYWLTRNEPGKVTAVSRIYPAKDWLRSRLTGDWSTDRVDALGTLMFDVSTSEWSAPICDLIGWPVASLPPVGRSEAIAGHITQVAAQACGLPQGIPVVRGSSDTAVEALGAGMLDTNTATIKLATAATISCYSHAPADNKELISYSYLVPESWYLITGTNSCASAHEWLRKTLFSAGGERAASFAEMDCLAGAIAPGAEGLFFHPYLNGERTPYWDPKLRADFVGLGFNHNPGHIIRAFYEGIAYSLRDCLEIFKQENAAFSSARITGGGARSNFWRQIVADTLEIPIELPMAADASYGAALLAGIGTGVFENFNALAGVIRTAARNEPIAANVEIYRRGFETYRLVQRQLAPAYHQIFDAQQKQNAKGESM
ncbi:MAG: xylulokinase [Rhizobiaceae bacterium]|nr:xylulokinase [Rhizobiaceae bacterium]